MGQKDRQTHILYYIQKDGRWTTQKHVPWAAAFCKCGGMKYIYIRYIRFCFLNINKYIFLRLLNKLVITFFRTAPDPTFGNLSLNWIIDV